MEQRDCKGSKWQNTAGAKVGMCSEGRVLRPLVPEVCRIPAHRRAPWGLLPPQRSFLFKARSWVEVAASGEGFPGIFQHFTQVLSGTAGPVDLILLRAPCSRVQVSESGRVEIEGRMAMKDVAECSNHLGSAESRAAHSGG